MGLSQRDAEPSAVQLCPALSGRHRPFPEVELLTCRPPASSSSCGVDGSCPVCMSAVPSAGHVRPSWAPRRNPE